MGGGAVGLFSTAFAQKNYFRKKSMPLCRVLWFLLNKLLSHKKKAGGVYHSLVRRLWCRWFILNKLLSQNKKKAKKRVMCSGREQPGGCAGDSHDGGWRWGAPFGHVAWSRLDPCTGSGTVLFGSGQLFRSSGAAPALKPWEPGCLVYRTHPGWWVPACGKTAITKVSRGLRERRRVPKLVVSVDGHELRLKNVTIKPFLSHPGVPCTTPEARLAEGRGRVITRGVSSLYRGEGLCFTPGWASFACDSLQLRACDPLPPLASRAPSVPRAHPAAQCPRRRG